ncbi:NAD-dependent epimerase/dehydratase family protein [Candidatus Actinomarina]|nr:NAD-dependent epimerase/dehydratase family protein [Candidatus Actinomarina sp.]
MNVLVLGSSGQVGSNLTEYLRKKDYEVIEFDIVNSEEQDLRIFNNILLEQKIKSSDFVVFLAFDVGGSRYLEKYQNTFDFVNNNNLIMVNTFSLLKKYDRKFIFASSQMSNMGHSSYGVLKNIGAKYTHSIGGLVFKLWNCYGYEADEEKSHVITDFIKKGFEKKEISMLTDGNEERDFLYIEDCSEALEILISNYDKIDNKEEINIASHINIKIIEIAKIIKQKFEKIGIDVEIVPSSETDSIQKNKKNLPNNDFKAWWEPSTNIEDGISNIFDMYKKNYEY